MIPSGSVVPIRADGVLGNVTLGKDAFFGAGFVDKTYFQDFFRPWPHIDTTMAKFAANGDVMWQVIDANPAWQGGSIRLASDSEGGVTALGDDGYETTVWRVDRDGKTRWTRRLPILSGDLGALPSGGIFVIGTKVVDDTVNATLFFLDRVGSITRTTAVASSIPKAKFGLVVGMGITADAVVVTTEWSDPKPQLLTVSSFNLDGTLRWKRVDIGSCSDPFSSAETRDVLMACRGGETATFDLFRYDGNTGELASEQIAGDIKRLSQS